MATANLLQTSVSGGTQNALSLQGDGVFFPKASTTSRLALTLTTTDKGFIVYDTTDNNIYFWNGAAWESIPGSGDAGANGSVQYNDNGIVSGATNFVWDKVNGRVGIGTASPAYPLHVVGTGYFSSVLTLGGASRLSAEGSNALNLNTNSVDRLIIDATGNIGVAVTPSAWTAGVRAIDIVSGGLGVFSGGVTHNAFFDSVDGRWEYKINGAATYHNYQGGIHEWYVAASGTANTAITTFGAGSATTLNATSNLVLRGGTAGANGVGLTFPATQVASSDANCLDDYEEGTFTPTPNSGTFSAATGRYTKIGNMVTIFFDITIGTGGGSQITNLPFVASGSSTVASGIYTNAQTYAASTTAPVVVIGASGSIMYFRTVGTGVAFSAMTLTAAANLTGSISYFV